MIEKAQGYKVGMAFFTTLKEAQVVSLASIIDGASKPDCELVPCEIADQLIRNADKVLAILSPPKELRQRATRKDKGTKRPRKTSTAPEQNGGAA